MDVLWFEVSVTSICSVPDCVTLTTMPEASDTYSKLCPVAFHFPADCTPLVRNSGGVASRITLDRTRFKFARITAQSIGGSERETESTGCFSAPSVAGTSGLAGWHGSLRRYSESVRQTNPARGNESAGCSEDHFCPTETPPGGAPALALNCAIQ